MLERAGTSDLARVAADLRAQLPAPLWPLASVACNYAWSWTRTGSEIFAAIDAYLWDRCRHDPVRLLADADPELLARAADDAELVRRATALAGELEAMRARPWAPRTDPERPVAYLCAEFGIHESLPLYSGGLGVLAGDVLKQASDDGIPMVGIGLLYHLGYFRQRLDVTGWQHESWTDVDPRASPSALVSADGRPVEIAVEIRGRPVTFRIRRVDVGRTPLYLLDSDVPGNTPVERWITARLYEGNRTMRLAQYAALGIGGVRALAALGITPSVFHLNEGHAALAALELVQQGLDAGLAYPAARAAATARLAFTTHTPVAAGNDVFPIAQVAEVVTSLATTHAGAAPVLDSGDGTVALTPVALATSRHANAVSRRHGEVARAMWRPAPIEAITNGVHLPTWLSPPMRRLLDAHLGDAWLDRADDPAVWARIRDIPDEDLWAARREARRRLIDEVRTRSVTDRLRRGEPLEYVEAATRSLDADILTIGFARRLAGYKRLHLVVADPARALRLLGTGRVQFLMAGKGHPDDDAGKRVVQTVFRLKSLGPVAERVAFLEDYDLALARALVSGCDVWANLPRPPLEACGTSGMKAVVNGGLHLSVLDGWWAECHDGDNGWAIDGTVAIDEAAQDARDAARLFDLLEREVIPLFLDRDGLGIPRRWIAKIKASMTSLGPRVAASRMLGEYARVWAGTPNPR